MADGDGTTAGDDGGPVSPPTSVEIARYFPPLGIVGFGGLPVHARALAGGESRR